MATLPDVTVLPLTVTVGVTLMLSPLAIPVAFNSILTELGYLSYTLA